MIPITPQMVQAAAQTLSTAIRADAETEARWAPQPADLTSGGGGVFGMFDNSGWTVSTGKSKATATAGDRANGMAGGMPAPGVVPAMEQATGSRDLFAGYVDNSTALLIGAILLGAVLLARGRH